MDDQLAAVLQDASENKRTTTAQTDIVLLVNNYTQTDGESDSEMLRLIIDTVVELEKKVTEIQLAQATHSATTSTSAVVSTALSSLNDPYDF